MRILLLAACLLAALVFAQNAVPPKPGRTTFTSADGTFRVTYPDLLVRCERVPQNGDGYSWSPDVCTSYFPVCQPVQDQVTTFCVAYPHNHRTDTPAFAGATFTVADIKAASEKDCFAGSNDLQPDNTHPTVIIRDVRFRAFELSSAGMNKSFDAHVYRVFHASRCVQLAIAEGGANAQVFDPPVRELSKDDEAEINSRLQQARDSFEFLK